MRDDEEEDFFDDPEFLENFQKYEKAHKNGEPIYMDAEDLTDIAEFYMTQNREEEANEAISLALSLYPDSIDPLIFLSRQQMFHDNLDEAIKIAHSIPDQNDRETIFLWTEILIRSEKPEEALQFILSKQEEMEEDDEDEDMFLYDAACIFMDYQEHEIAQQLISMLEEKFPQNANFRKLKIENLVSMEEFDKAISLMQNFIDEHPYSTSAWRIMAEAYVGKGDFLGALDNIEYCLAINPTSAQALMVKAHCLFHLNQLTQAHEIYLQLQKTYPENGRCYYMDAITLANMEKFSEAKDCIRIALKYTPEYDEERVQVLVHKAYIESKCHNVKKALRQV